jgi:Tol biopolymer transport system component
MVDKLSRSARVNRREMMAIGAGGLATVGTALPLADAIAAPGEEQVVKVDAATNVALALSPDGRTLAMDLLGILWTIPVDGGPARRLTSDFDDLGQPEWSPDGSRIVFQSYRSGNFHLWTMPAAGGALTQLTEGLFDHREPRWSPDGRHIAFSSDRAGDRYAIYLIDVASGTINPLSKGDTQDSEPCWTPDGSAVVYVASGTRLVRQPIDGGEAATLVEIAASGDRMRPSELHAPAFAPDGTLHYTRIADGGVTLQALPEGGEATALAAGRDIYPFRPAFAADGTMIFGADGAIRRRAKDGTERAIPFTASVPVTTPAYQKKTRDLTSTTPRPVVGIVAPALSPDGKQIAFGALNDLWLMPIGGAPRKLVSGGAYKVDPAWSPDGKRIAYASDRGGTLDIWIHDLKTGENRQLTNLPKQGLVSPAWSPDGATIACLDQEGALQSIDIATGTVRRVYEPLWEPGRPSFGPGGQTIVYAAFKPFSARYREGLSEVLTVDVATGKGSYRPVAPGKSIGVRGLDGPVWSPDGSMMAYVFASTLWVVPVDAKGNFTGPARQITNEVTDAPSWSGDSSKLLYLSNGSLRLVPATGGTPRTIPHRLTWANAIPTDTIVIEPERVWDGASAAATTGRAVVVKGNKIAAIVAAGTVHDANARHIAAPGQTLMPGLIDMHTHRQMQGYNYGDRMGRIWLSMGITATRSPGCPAYHMVEDREAIQGGHRVAPRHFATGEAIDGGRIFYNFMRPVTEPGQMALELSRAKALDYDMVKTYVRLRHDMQAEVVRQAHAMGMHLSSHYHYPALHSGMDCMEHMGATNRYGYSRTITATGAGYQDVNGLFAAAKAMRTPTLFIASALLGEDDALARDPRITALFPAWEYAKLTGRVSAMQKADRAPLLASLQRQVDQIKQTMALGGRVIAGTDAPIDLVAISLHLNLRGMVRCGLTPLDALQTATRNAGEFLDEPIGVVAPGKLADLILVAGDPLTDITAAAAVRTTICNGVVHTPDALIEPFAAPQVSSVRNRTLSVHNHGERHFWEMAAYVEESRHACCADHITPRHA